MIIPEKPEVLNKINELKQRFKNELSPSLQENTHLFHSFLKEKKFNLNEAESMLRKHIEWRKEMKVDNILTEEIITPEMVSYISPSIIGFDKEHSPVIYFPFGNLDFKGIHSSLKFAVRIRYMIKVLENWMVVLQKQSLKYNKEIERFVLIIDMKNFSFMNATNKQNIEECIIMLRMFQDNYPERLKSVVVINAFSYFSLTYSVVKTFLASSIADLLQIYSNEDEWKPVLLEKMDPEVLPVFLGGSKTDTKGDPLCKTFVNHLGTIPEHLHICKSKRSLAKTKNVNKLVIQRSSFSEIELEVKKAGSFIEWEFETKHRDIGFGLFFSEKDSNDEEKITELVPLLRLDTEEFTETGMYKCHKPGKYVILFDNSYSWMRSKEIYYKAIVVTPEQHEKEMTLT